MKFTFHKIDNGIDSGWMCLVDNFESFCEVLSTLNRQCLNIYKKIQKSNPNKIGHAGSWEASLLKILLGLKMEQEGMSEIPCTDAMNLIMDFKTKAFYSVYKEYGMVYIGANGGVFPTPFLSSSEKIIDICYSDQFVFPDVDKSYFEIKKWPMGRHFYILDRGEIVRINGMEKWNRLETAQTMLKEYLNSHIRSKIAGSM